MGQTLFTYRLLTWLLSSTSWVCWPCSLSLPGPRKRSPRICLSLNCCGRPTRMLCTQRMSPTSWMTSLTRMRMRGTLIPAHPVVACGESPPTARSMYPTSSRTSIPPESSRSLSVVFSLSLASPASALSSAPTIETTSTELQIIERGLQSFSGFSCIRFVKRTNHRDYLHIQSLNGCYSYVGRTGNAQTVSLSRQGCIYHNTVQHELLHALGFNHEQTRSDRDQYIRVLLQNVQSGMQHNFNKINTLNQGTPYDYNSVMQYHRYAFSKNNQPTMVPIPNQNIEIGKASQMSRNDIDRLNRLYKC